MPADAAMRTLIFLMLGLLLAIGLGGVYLELSAPAAEASAETTAARVAWAALDGQLIALLVFSWATVFLPMPVWLTLLTLAGTLFAGAAIALVSGAFVYLHYPKNTLADTHYVVFLCGLAILASQVVRVMRLASRSGTPSDSAG